MEIWIVAGEPSGDRYGSRLALELQRARPEVRIAGMGGALMRAAGVDIIVDSTDLAVMGLVEVLGHLPTFYKVFHHLLQEAAKRRPSAVVLIDYPGFNLRFARRLHDLGIPVVYYVCPQVWAWGRRRIPRIARIVDKMLAIYPFEPAVFAGTGLDVEFVGHPLLSILEEHADPSIERTPNEIVLLPGSRTMEIQRILPVMLKTMHLMRRENPDLSFVLSVPERKQEDLARSICERAARSRLRIAPPEIEHGRTLYRLQRAAAGLAASGTVTVEAAILGLPLVVMYRVNWITYLVARQLVHVPYITMVNLVLNRLVYEEFIQHQARPRILADAMAAIMPDGVRRAEVEAGMNDLRQALGGAGNASERAANAILRFIERRQRQPSPREDSTIVLGDAPGPGRS